MQREKVLRVIHERLRVAVVLLGGERSRGVDGEVARPGAADRVDAREGRFRWVDGEELGGGRGAVPAAPQEKEDAEGDEAEQHYGADDAACDRTRVGLGGGFGAAALVVGGFAAGFTAALGIGRDRGGDEGCRR